MPYPICAVWDNLTSDAHDAILSHALCPKVEAKICLSDPDQCVSFLDVVGTPLSNNSLFACNLDGSSVPEMDDEEAQAVYILNWFEFRLRRMADGSLVLPNGEEDVEWVKVGQLKHVPVPNYTWHGVSKKTSDVTNYNCLLYNDIEVNEGSDEDGMPGYFFKVLLQESATIDGSDPDDPFNTFYNA